jgi:hypothetical protein
MSLEVAAKHLAAHGRGPDDQLIHMSGKEVAGLQALAKAAGGSLTINPHTGLAEAGFLDSLLPTIVGAGLTYFSGGMINPLTAGLIVGGVETARTGDLGKGALAGLGGFGGAGMVGGLAGAGAAGANAAAVPEFALSSGAPLNAAAGAVPEFALSSGAPLNTVASEAMGPLGFKDAVSAGASNFAASPSMAALGGGKYLAAAAAPTVMDAMQPKARAEPDKTPQMIRPYKYDYNPQTPSNMIGSQYQPTGQDTSERQWFNPSYTALPPYQAANGGIIALAAGGPVERMSNQAAMGANTMYPMANMSTSSFATPYQSPVSTNMLAPTSDSGVTMNGEPNMQGTRMANGGYLPHYDVGGAINKATDPRTPFTDSMGNAIDNTFEERRAAGGAVPRYGFGGFLGDAVNDIGSNLGHMFKGGDDAGWQKVMEMTADANNQQAKNAQNPMPMAMGGIASLGGYSDGGRLLRGPGDGVSDSIPAQIGNKQPARLADGEFVVPARIVSELGNGSTEAGAKQLYKMLDRVQNARGKTTAKGKVAKNTNAAKLLPA